MRPPLLSKCDTCKEPKPGKSYRRDVNKMRHGSCIVCEDKLAEVKRKRISEVVERKRAYNKDYYDKYVRKTPRRVKTEVSDVPVQTKWRTV